MTRKRIRCIGVTFGMVLGIAGCAQRDCPSGEVTVTKTDCHWTAAVGSGRSILCTVGPLRVKVDTTGIGEG